MTSNAVTGIQVFNLLGIHVVDFLPPVYVLGFVVMGGIVAEPARMVDISRCLAAQMIHSVSQHGSHDLSLLNITLNSFQHGSQSMG